MAGPNDKTFEGLLSTLRQRVTALERRLPLRSSFLEGLGILIGGTGAPTDPYEIGVDPAVVPQIGISAPYRIAAGTVLAAANVTGSVAVSFPVGRFSQPPVVTLGQMNWLANANVLVTSVTATGFLLVTFNIGTGAGLAGIGCHWEAVQMTPGSGPG